MPDVSSSPLITVISITLNDPDGLECTIKSLQSQEQAPDFEHIVIDGMSGYDVVGLLAEMGSQAKLHQGHDAGLYDAMNRGTDLARGDYLLYLNGGDKLASPMVLASVAMALTGERPDFLYGDSLETKNDGTVERKAARNHRHAPFGMFTHHQSMVFSREILSKSRIRYNLDYPIAADYDFVLRFLDKSKKVTCYLGLISNFSAGGVSQVRHHAGRREQFLVRKRHFKSGTFATRVYAMQIASKYLRMIAPKLYWQVRTIYVNIFR